MVMDRMGTSEYLVANTRYACTPRLCHPKNDDSGWSQPRINGYLGDKRVSMSWFNCHPYLYVYLTATNSGGRSQHLVLQGSSQLLGREHQT